MHPLLIEGLSDAVGFAGGALVGYWASVLLGLDIFGQGDGAGQLAGIALVGAGGGGGLQLARRWRSPRWGLARRERGDE